MALYCALILFFIGLVSGSVINNVRLVNHAAYAIEVITEAVQAVENKEWCNLKLPDFSVDVDELVLDWHAQGTVHYTNGFLHSIQNIDIQQATVQQVWSFDNTDQTTSVTVRGTLRMHSVAIGYDVVANFQDVNGRFSTVYTHPMISFAFSIIKNIHSDTLQVTVVGTVPRVTTVRPVTLPHTPPFLADFLNTFFNPELTAPGIIAWGPDVFEPITLDIVKTKVAFPELCYNCPVTA